MPAHKKDKYSPANMVERINEYIEKKCQIVTLVDSDGCEVKHVFGFPIYKECLLENKWTPSRVHDLRKSEGYEEVDKALERLVAWKEVRLEIGGAYGYINKTYMAMALNQLGWDKQKQEDVKVNVVVEGADGLGA